MTMTRWTRREIEHVLAARHGQGEGHGLDAYIVVKIKVTPEFLEGMLGATWTNRDGTRSEFVGVDIDGEGFAEPILHRVENRRLP